VGHGDPVSPLAITTRTCDHCPAQIFMAETSRGVLMPVNAAIDPDGNVAVRSAAGVLKCRVLGKSKPLSDEELHTSHFADCPAADRMRRRRW
jgi:hypothetical protein